MNINYGQIQSDRNKINMIIEEIKKNDDDANKRALALLYSTSNLDLIDSFFEHNDRIETQHVEIFIVHTLTEDFYFKVYAPKEKPQNKKIEHVIPVATSQTLYKVV